MPAKRKAKKKKKRPVNIRTGRPQARRRVSTVVRTAQRLAAGPRRPIKQRTFPIPEPETVEPDELGTRETPPAGVRKLRGPSVAKRAKQFSEIKKRVRPRKSEAGQIIFVTAEPVYQGKGKRRKLVEPAGTRVPRNTRRKVYAFRVTRPSKKHPRGKLVPYYTREEQHLKRKLPPKAIKAWDFDPTVFKSKQAVNWWWQDKVIQPAKGKAKVRQPRLTPVVGSRKKEKDKGKPMHTLPLEKVNTFSVKQRKGVRRGLDFMSGVVPKVSQLLQDVANEVGEKRDLKVNWWARVRMPGGKHRTFSGFVMFRQADMQQFMDLGFYEPFVAKALYANMAGSLAAEGMVTTGSSQYIRKLPINKGVPKSEWRDRNGMLWKHEHHHKRGAEMDEVTLERFDVTVEKTLKLSGDR